MKKKMKGVILHGGHGTRLRPLTHTGPKQLLPISNKPMSQYALEDLREAGITDIAIIIGDVYPEKVKEFYEDGKKFGVKLSYIYQDKPKGIAHARRLCKKFIGNDRFVVYLGDNVLRTGLVNYSKKFSSSKSDAMILLCEVDDPSRFGIAELDGTKIKNIVEKPKNPSSNLAVIGVYFLTPKIFDIIDKLKPSWRGELEITEALQLMMDNKLTIIYDTVTGWWKDTGTPEDILHANQLILDSIGTKNQFHLDEGVKVQGTIVIGRNKNWKQKCNMGKKNNQNFVSIPFYKLIRQIKYKALIAGIKVVETREDYTSKCSFLDLETIKKHKKYKGYRKYRGMYKSKKYGEINADVNGSYNILRKVFPGKFKKKGIEGFVVNPISYTLCKV